MSPEIRKPHHFYNAYTNTSIVIHQENDVDVLRCSSFTVQTKIIPLLYMLANVCNEILWNDRLDPWNHCRDFPRHVTGMVDTLPVYVQQPTRARDRNPGRPKTRDAQQNLYDSNLQCAEYII